MVKRARRQVYGHDMTLEIHTVRIGKRGTTDPILQEISRQLDKREMVKVKILKTALASEDVGEVAQRVVAETDSELVQLRGHTFTLYRPKRG
jgi:RNA-binding protein